MLKTTGKAIALLTLAFSSSLVFATATVSGNLQDAGGTAVSSRTFVRFWLRGCANNQPRVNGVALIVPPGGPGYYKDFTPDASGAIVGNIYKNSEVECNGATGNTWYGVQVYRDGKPGPETPYSVVNPTFNLNTATPTVQSPPPPPATFPYIMANPTGTQTIAGFPLILGSGSGISATYQGSVAGAGRYLKSNGTSFIASSLAAPGVGNCSVAGQFVSALNGDAAPTCSGPAGGGTNGVIYNNGSGFASTAAGGAGTLCLVSTNGGVPAFSACSGSNSTAWSALGAPSADLNLSMAARTTAFNWGTGSGANALFTFNAASGDGTGPVVMVQGQPGAPVFLVRNNLGLPLFEVAPTQISVVQPLSATTITASGAISGSSLALAGAITGATSVNATSVTATATISGAGLVSSGTVRSNVLQGTFSDSLTLTIAADDSPATGFPGQLLLLKAGKGGNNGARGNDVLIVGGDGGTINGDGGGVYMRSGIPNGVGGVGRVKVFDVNDNSKEVIFKPEVLASGTSATVGQAVSGTASLDFDLSAAGITCQDLILTVAGATDGNAVDLGLTNALGSNAGMQFSAWVSAANTVTVRGCDLTAANPNPAPATVRAVVWKF